jgi:glutathione S-transferase
MRAGGRALAPAAAPPGRALAPAAAPLAGGEPPRRRRWAAMTAMPPAARLAWSIEEAGAAPPAVRPDETLLYAHTLCPYAERVVLTLLESGAEFRCVHVDLARKPSWFRNLGSGGLVPAVARAGRVRAESLDLLRALPRELGAPALAPPGAELDAALAAGARAADAGVAALAGAGRGWGIDARGPSAAQAARFAAALDAAVGAPLARHGGPFLGGAQPSVADFALFPFLRRFAVAMPAFGGADVRGACGGAVGAWLGALGARPAARAAAADDALLLAAYRHHMCLDFFDYDSYRATALHPHNAAYLRE